MKMTVCVRDDRTPGANRDAWLYSGRDSRWPEEAPTQARGLRRKGARLIASARSRASEELGGGTQEPLVSMPECQHEMTQI